MHPLEKMILEGEHQQQDFKYFLNDAKKIARTLAAFANTDGGRLLVGVKDNGKVVGLKHKDEEVYVVEAAANVFCMPAVVFETRYWNYEGRTVLDVWVPKSGQAPHTAPAENGKAACFIRKEDENKVASELETAVLRLKYSPQPLTLSMDKQLERLTEVLKTYDASNGYDIRTLSRLSLMTEKECVEALARLIAGGTI